LLLLETVLSLEFSTFSFLFSINFLNLDFSVFKIKTKFLLEILLVLSDFNQVSFGDFLSPIEIKFEVLDRLLDFDLLLVAFVRAPLFFFLLLNLEILVFLIDFANLYLVRLIEFALAVFQVLVPGTFVSGKLVLGALKCQLVVHIDLKDSCLLVVVFEEGALEVLEEALREDPSVGNFNGFKPDAPAKSDFRDFCFNRFTKHVSVFKDVVRGRV